MTKRDLNMNNHGDNVRHQDVLDLLGPGVQRPDQNVEEPVEEERESGDLEIPQPSGFPARSLVGEQVLPRKPVQVESAETQDWVVEMVLELDQELGKTVEPERFLVVGGVDVAEQPRADCEERQMLDVWVVDRVVCDEMVHVVVSFPPAKRQSTHPVGDEDSNEVVDVVVMGDGEMACIVRDERELLPK
ncbi:hypothetical protein OGAPHI_003359 [Ogataea philodendri]|uniref:Uncharacterized protein n=1 Tax=Ogataea philodendri TaxID=1378263 RepID=A0A9P8P8I8_9ASCO|nr:uncharacterized protein OGAPHI_003359 [Ogataea philodendri]KAH3666909.1 hypothetical protein OGAPHI_003359 [Ogataea philodendri]